MPGVGADRLVESGGHPRQPDACDKRTSGVAERFVSDLRESVKYVRETPNIEGGMAPIYGLAASIPDRSFVHDMLKQVMDIYYRL